MRIGSDHGLIIFTPQIVAYGGIERNIIALSEYLNRRGLRHKVLCFYDKIGLSKYAGHPIKVVQLTGSRNPLVKAWILGRFLKADWQRTGKRPLLFGIKGAFNMGIFHACPFVLHFTDPPSLISRSNRPVGFRGLLHDLLQKGAHILTKRGTRRADCVITMTQRNADELAARYNVKVIVLRQGGLSPAGASVPMTGNGNCLTMLSVCRLESSKRLDWMIEAVAELQPRMTREIRLDLVGEGSQKSELERLAVRLGISSQVHFLGMLSNLELEEVFARASVFVMPAVQGYGLPALEALYRAIPIVLHRESGVSEILIDTPWASVFDGGKTELFNALQIMIGRVMSNQLNRNEIPRLPTEPEWAKQIASICWNPDKMN